jgi:anti-sigma factor (TIGR02949 family)
MTEMLDCGAVMRQLWDYLDGELTADRMDAIREHLKMCQRCQPHSEFELAFLGALARVRREHSNPPAVANRVRAALVARGYSVA